MNAKFKFSLKYALGVIVIFSAIQCVSSDNDNNDDDATVESEQSEPLIDIPYTGPVPSGKIIYVEINLDNCFFFLYY